MYYGALFVFNLVYFVVNAATTFLSKYFGELGISDSQIGLLMSLPALAAVLFQPYFGALTDRARLKKFVLIGLLAAVAAIAFVMDRLTTFVPLFLGMVAFNVLQMPISPAYSAITLEYTRREGKAYGPIRLMGTVGYQLGALLVGVILATSLQGLYRLIGVVLLACCGLAFFLPPIAGHQHGRSKVKFTALFQDRHVRALFLMIFIATLTSQFYILFFSKYLGDLGISNTVTGIMLVVSVAMEIPFLIFADKLAKKMSVWNWLMIGFALNAVRWIGLALSKSVLWLLVFQVPGISVMACFEFFPALYLNRRVPDALKGSAQTMLILVSFGLAKVISGAVGGFASDRFGIPAVFLFCGAFLIVAAAVLWRPTRRLIREEGGEACE